MTKQSKKIILSAFSFAFVAIYITKFGLINSWFVFLIKVTSFSDFKLQSQSGNEAGAAIFSALLVAPIYLLLLFWANLMILFIFGFLFFRLWRKI